MPDYDGLVEQLRLYTQLKHEHGAHDITGVHNEAQRALKAALKTLKALPIDQRMAKNEPDALPAIQRLRPRGPRRLWRSVDKVICAEKVEGALLARMAGCALGAIVEGWPIERMAAWARRIGDCFPPVDYWSAARDPERVRYGLSPCSSYTRGAMSGVPVDDDIAYTLLGLLIAEEHGPGFTTGDVARAWLKHLPVAATAEHVALQNLKRGVAPEHAAEVDNPYREWIGADIRADPWGYLAPGWPERAASLAYRDAFLSHRRQGVYGAMYFAAAIAAAFAVDHPVHALELGLTEIPRQCRLAKALRWALKTGHTIHDYRDARQAVDARFRGMHIVHTVNNACLTVFGLVIGGTDVTKVLSQTVAMGMDNDCTAATAGSIVGAVVGKRGIPGHWYQNFHNTVHSYLIGKRRFTISGLVRRFSRQAARIARTAGLPNGACGGVQ